jgi:hypothetical protein
VKVTAIFFSNNKGANQMTEKQTEMMKDLHEAMRQGFKGLGIRKSEKKHYLELESQGLVYFLHRGITNDYSIRLTNKGESSK